MPSFPTARADEFIAVLTRRLSPKTFDHSLSVAHYMVSIAERAGITGEQAATTGLLHDVCKAMSGEALRAAAEKWGIEATDLQREKPKLLHGPVAAEEARREFGVSDPGVYEAIYWHTTGRPGWNPVGLALYVADFAEPLRTMPESAEARALLDREGFGAALRFVTQEKCAYIAHEFTLDPMTEAFGHWVESTVR